MSARDYALWQLDRRRLPDWPAGAVRWQRPPAPPGDPRDIALAEQLTVGVIKNLLHLQHLSSHFAARPLRSIEPAVRKILALGLYQMRFLTRIPVRAAVDEAVDQTRRIGLGRAAGFVNAVLRAAATRPSPPMPDPRVDPAGYAELVLSHPRDLFERLAAQLGTETALRFCAHSNRQPPTIVRLLPGASIDALSGEGVTVAQHQTPGMFIVQGAPAPCLARWAQEGLAQAQDPTAAAVVPLLEAREGDRVLDRCAGLGTKTLQIRDTFGPRVHITAMEPSEARLSGLRAMLKARGIADIEVRQCGMLGAPPPGAQLFERILVDVPCSNSGVLARRPEARYAQTPAALRSLVMLQDRLLDDTAPWLAPGGRLVYSTCSIWPEENQQRVAGFLERHAGWQLIQEQLILPALDAEDRAYHDGGYVAILQRERGD